jgi:hypothetical protein
MTEMDCSKLIANLACLHWRFFHAHSILSIQIHLSTILVLLGQTLKAHVSPDVNEVVPRQRPRISVDEETVTIEESPRYSIHNSFQI